MATRVVNQQVLSEIHRAFVEDGEMLFAAVRFDGTCVYASPFVSELLGRDVDDVVGQNVIDWVHPDDLNRAAYQLGSAEHGSPGAGLSRFDVLHADGTYHPIEVMATKIEPGGEPMLGFYVRSGMHQGFVTQQVLEMLLKGAPREEALAPVCDIVQWRRLGSRVAVSWIDDAGSHQIGCDLPDSLGGGDGHENTPWGRCRERGKDLHGDLEDLDGLRRVEAEAIELEQFWIVPVIWSEEFPPATVTVWTGSGGPAPIIHSYGVNLLTNLVTMIMRWTEQLRELGLAARSDALTGLTNRRGFFDSLEASETGGAVLFCDLDRFKPVNDEFGHVFGDDVLRLVARRLLGCCREDDVVARIGGDEFAVLCTGAEEKEAVAIAERIRTALMPPFEIGGNEVTIGVSIGVAVDASEVTDTLLGQADRALAAAKLDGGAVVRVVGRHHCAP